MTEAEKKAARELALANWESATMRNLSPYLDESQTDKVWAAMLAYRTGGDILDLKNDLHAVTAIMFDAGVSNAAAAALDSLRTLIAADAAEDTNHA